MTRASLLLVMCLTLAACSTTSSPLLLTAASYGLVRFGTGLDAVEALLNEQASTEIFNAECGFVTFASYPDIEFMVEKGVVVRADAGKTIANETGYAAGASSSDLQKAYPQMRVMPHKYDPAGQYLILAAADGGSALVFEASNGLITRVRAGVEPAVEYVERCG